MEELSSIAKAYFKASSSHFQKLARDFFRVMDHDSDGNIDKKEFLEFMRDEGYAQMTNSSFFNQLDLDGNGTLDFFEVMTLYYIVKSERPFCDCCKKFITSTYFTCVGCLEDPLEGSSFYLCLDCYIMEKCAHTHNDLSRFIDNYSLLQHMIKSKLSELKSPEARSRPYGTSSVPDKPPPYNNHTWNPSLNMVQDPYRPPLVHNHQSWNQCPPTVPLQYVAPWNPSLNMVQNPYRPPLVHNHQSWNQCPPTVPLQYYVAPPVHNHPWIQNHYSYHYPPPYPVYPAASNPVAVVPQQQQWKIALEALNSALNIGAAIGTVAGTVAVGSTLCSIL